MTLETAFKISSVGFRVIFNDESEVVQQVGQDVWIRVYNDSGVAISKGKVAYLSGIFSLTPTIAKALAETLYYCIKCARVWNATFAKTRINIASRNESPT